MNCTDCDNLIEEYSLGQLAEPQRRAVRDHLDTGCQSCLETFKTYEGIWADVGASISPVDPPDSVRDRLLHRIATPQEVLLATTTTASHDQTARRWTFPVWSTWLAATVLPFTVAGLLYLLIYTRREVRSLREDVATRNDSIEQLDDELRRARSIFREPQLRFAALKSVPAQPSVRGFSVLDPLAHQIHIFVFDLPQPPPNREYRVWISQGSEEATSLGSFIPDGNGNGSLLVAVDENLRIGFKLEVTDEPIKDQSAPSGQVWLTTDVAQSD